MEKNTNYGSHFNSKLKSFMTSFAFTMSLEITTSRKILQVKQDFVNQQKGY